MRLRLGIAGVMFLISLLIVLPAPTVVVWVLTLLATEWSHWLVLVTLAIMVWIIRTGVGRARIIAISLLLIATGLLCIPVVEGFAISRELPDELTKAFGSPSRSSALPTSPFSFARLWWSSRPNGIIVQHLTYPTTRGQSLALDFYSNGTTDTSPCVVIVHGGAWRSGSEKELVPWNYILAGSGYRVASIAYRLTPQFHWPAQKEDLLAAVSYLKANASHLGIDSTKLVLWGRSAGAQIILATAYSAHDPAIRGCIASYPPTDMNFDYGPASKHSVLNADKVISQFLGGTPEQVSEVYRDASACRLVGASTPPTLISQGTRDEVVWIENSRKLRDDLVQAHRPVFLLELPWATHAFDLNSSGPGGQLELYAIEWFLDSVFQARP